jgi:hypothetical protein
LRPRASSAWSRMSEGCCQTRPDAIFSLSGIFAGIFKNLIKTTIPIVSQQEYHALSVYDIQRRMRTCCDAHPLGTYVEGAIQLMGELPRLKD